MLPSVLKAFDPGRGLSLSYYGYYVVLYHVIQFFLDFFLHANW